MSFSSFLKYIKNLFNNDNKLKPLTFNVNIKNIKLDPKVSNSYAEDKWNFNSLDGSKYVGAYSYTKSNKNYTLAQHKEWALKEFQAQYSVPDGLITDCDCEVYLNYATIKDWKAYCNDEIELPLPTIDKRVF